MSSLIKTDVKQTMGLLTKKAVMGAFDISNTTLHQWMRERGFPKPAYLTNKSPVWREQEVKAWVDARFATTQSS